MRSFSSFIFDSPFQIDNSISNYYLQAKSYQRLQKSIDNVIKDYYNVIEDNKNGQLRLKGNAK